MDFRLTHAEINILRDIFSPRIVTFEKKENIICSPQRLYIVLDGLLYLCTENELYERSILRFMRQGEILTSSLTIDIYNGISYILAKTSCKMAVISKRDIDLYLSDHPLWRERLNEVMNDGPHEHELYMNYMLHRKTIRSRLLCFLRDESKSQQSDSLHLPLPLSDVADYLGVERTALMKEIGKMKKEGIIKGKNRDITLLV